jgi:hypothetical protein
VLSGYGIHGTKPFLPTAVSSPHPPLIAAKRILIGLSVAAALALASSATALAAPAGDEYLPKVPSATGHQASGGNDGSSGTAATTSAVPSTSATPSISATGSSGAGSTKDKPKVKKDRKPAPAATPAASVGTGSSGGGSSGLFDPIVLLIVAGVIVAAVGMTLRRRHGGDPLPATETSEGGEKPGAAPNARPTPEGEIVAGDKAL